MGGPWAWRWRPGCCGEDPVPRWGHRGHWRALGGMAVSGAPGVLCVLGTLGMLWVWAVLGSLGALVAVLGSLGGLRTLRALGRSFASAPSSPHRDPRRRSRTGPEWPSSTWGQTQVLGGLLDTGITGNVPSRARGGPRTIESSLSAPVQAGLNHQSETRMPRFPAGSPWGPCRDLLEPWRDGGAWPGPRSAHKADVDTLTLTLLWEELGGLG